MGQASSYAAASVDRALGRLRRSEIEDEDEVLRMCGYSRVSEKEAGEERVRKKEKSAEKEQAMKPSSKNASTLSSFFNPVAPFSPSNGEKSASPTRLDDTRRTSGAPKRIQNREGGGKRRGNVEKDPPTKTSAGGTAGHRNGMSGAPNTRAEKSSWKLEESDTIALDQWTHKEAPRRPEPSLPDGPSKKEETQGVPHKGESALAIPSTTPFFSRPPRALRPPPSSFGPLVRPHDIDSIYTLDELRAAIPFLPEALRVDLNRFSFLYVLDEDGDGRFSALDIQHFVSWAVEKLDSNVKGECLNDALQAACALECFQRCREAAKAFQTAPSWMKEDSTPPQEMGDERPPALGRYSAISFLSSSGTSRMIIPAEKGAELGHYPPRHSSRPPHLRIPSQDGHWTSSAPPLIASVNSCSPCEWKSSMGGTAPPTMDTSPVVGVQKCPVWMSTTSSSGSKNRASSEPTLVGSTNSAVPTIASSPTAASSSRSSSSLSRGSLPSLSGSSCFLRCFLPVEEDEHYLQLLPEVPLSTPEEDWREVEELVQWLGGVPSSSSSSSFLSSSSSLTSCASWKAEEEEGEEEEKGSFSSRALSESSAPSTSSHSACSLNSSSLLDIKKEHSRRRRTKNTSTTTKTEPPTVSGNATAEKGSRSSSTTTTSSSCSSPLPEEDPTREKGKPRDLQQALQDEHPRTWATRRWPRKEKGDPRSNRRDPAALLLQPVDHDKEEATREILDTSSFSSPPPTRDTLPVSLVGTSSSSTGAQQPKKRRHHNHQRGSPVVPQQTSLQERLREETTKKDLTVETGQVNSPTRDPHCTEKKKKRHTDSILARRNVPPSSASPPSSLSSTIVSQATVFSRTHSTIEEGKGTRKRKEKGHKGGGAGQNRNRLLSPEMLSTGCTISIQVDDGDEANITKVLQNEARGVRKREKERQQHHRQAQLEREFLSMVFSPSHRRGEVQSASRSPREMCGWSTSRTESTHLSEPITVAADVTLPPPSSSSRSYEDLTKPPSPRPSQGSAISVISNTLLWADLFRTVERHKSREASSPISSPMRKPPRGTYDASRDPPPPPHRHRHPPHHTRPIANEGYSSRSASDISAPRLSDGAPSLEGTIHHLPPPAQEMDVEISNEGSCSAPCTSILTIRSGRAGSRNSEGANGHSRSSSGIDPPPVRPPSSLDAFNTTTTSTRRSVPGQRPPALHPFSLHTFHSRLPSSSLTGLPLVTAVTSPTAASCFVHRSPSLPSLSQHSREDNLSSTSHFPPTSTTTTTTRMMNSSREKPAEDEKAITMQDTEDTLFPFTTRFTGAVGSGTSSVVSSLNSGKGAKHHPKKHGSGGSRLTAVHGNEEEDAITEGIVYTSEPPRKSTHDDEAMPATCSERLTAEDLRNARENAKNVSEREVEHSSDPGFLTDLHDIPSLPATAQADEEAQQQTAREGPRCPPLVLHGGGSSERERATSSSGAISGSPCSLLLSSPSLSTPSLIFAETSRARRFSEGIVLNPTLLPSSSFPVKEEEDGTTSSPLAREQPTTSTLSEERPTKEVSTGSLSPVHREATLGQPKREKEIHPRSLPPHAALLLSSPLRQESPSDALFPSANPTSLLPSSVSLLPPLPQTSPIFSTSSPGEARPVWMRSPLPSSRPRTMVFATTQTWAAAHLSTWYLRLLHAQEVDRYRDGAIQRRRFYFFLLLHPLPPPRPVLSSSLSSLPPFPGLQAEETQLEKKAPKKTGITSATSPASRMTSHKTTRLALRRAIPQRKAPPGPTPSTKSDDTCLRSHDEPHQEEETVATPARGLEVERFDSLSAAVGTLPLPPLPPPPSSFFHPPLPISSTVPSGSTHVSSSLSVHSTDAPPPPSSSSVFPRFTEGMLSLPSQRTYTIRAVEEIYFDFAVRESYDLSLWEFCQLLDRLATAAVEQGLHFTSSDHAAVELRSSEALEEVRRRIVEEWWTKKQQEEPPHETPEGGTPLPSPHEEEEKKREQGKKKQEGKAEKRKNGAFPLLPPPPLSMPPILRISHSILQLFVLCFVTAYWEMLQEIRPDVFTME